MERKSTDQLQQELMTGNDLDRVLADNDGSFQGYALQERLQEMLSTSFRALLLLARAGRLREGGSCTES